MTNYSNLARETTLTGSINAAATTISLASTVGLPSPPFTLALDYEGSTEELVTVTAMAGLNLTVTRGYDNTAATSHDLGARVRHVHSAYDFKRSRDHEGATAAHGITGAVLGTTDVQAVTNKNFTDASNTFPSSLATDTEVSNETTARTNADTKLQGNIDAEAKARTDADTALGGRIDTLKSVGAWEILTTPSGFSGTPQVRLHGDGTVELDMVDTAKVSATTATQYTLATLPAKYRPARSFYVPIFVGSEATSVQIGANGAVTTQTRDWAAGALVRGLNSWRV